MGSLKSKVLSGGLLRMLSVITAAIISLFTMPTLIHHLGKEGYSLWSLCTSFAGYVLIVDFGITRGFFQSFATCYGLENKEELNKIVSTSMVSFLVISICSAILGGILMSSYSLWVSDIHKQEFISVIFLLVVNSILHHPIKIFSGMLYTKVRHDILVSGQIAEIVIRMSAIVYAATHGYGIIQMALITLLTGILEYLWEIFWARRLFPEIRMRWKDVSYEKFKEIIGFSLPTFISDLSTFFRTQAILPIVSKLISLEAVVFISVSLRLVSYSASVLTSWTGMLLPIFGQISSNSHEQTKRMLRLSTTSVSAFSLFLMSNLILFGKPFISVWLGKTFDISYTLMVILSIGAFCTFITEPAKEFLLGIGKPNGLAIIHLTETIMSIVLGILLGQRFGITGIVCGFSISLVICELIMVPMLLKYYNIGLEIFKNTITAFPAFIVAFWFLYEYLESITINSFTMLLGNVIMGNVLLLAVFVWSLPKEMQQIIKTKLPTKMLRSMV